MKIQPIETNILNKQLGTEVVSKIEALKDKAKDSLPNDTKSTAEMLVMIHEIGLENLFAYWGIK